MNIRTLRTLFLALLTIVPASLGAAAIDPDWSTGSIWDDGQSEIAFYRLERSRDQYGRANDQNIVVGTYLVKHQFDPSAQTKSADGVAAFKWALFYEMESGAYQYKRAWVINAAQRDLQPLKASFTSFDWCSNRYEELAFHPDGTVESLMRSDDYGNSSATFESITETFPPSQIPLLVRGLAFTEAREQSFEILLADGKRVTARAELGGREKVSTEAGTFDAEKITVHYPRPVPSILGETTGKTETYWRGTGAERLLLKVDGGHYQLELIEHLRSPYWRENFYPRLKKIKERP